MTMFPVNNEQMAEAAKKMLRCNCGGSAQLRFADYPLRPGAIGFDVICDKCSWITPTCENPEAAIQKWNDHVQPCDNGFPEPDTPFQKVVKQVAKKMEADTIIEYMIAEELASANEKFPAFASVHEGYAVLKEEFEEVDSEMDEMFEAMDYIWTLVKAHKQNTIAKPAAGGVKRLAINAIKELIQVAAMCDKFDALGKSKDMCPKEAAPAKEKEASLTTHLSPADIAKELMKPGRSCKSCGCSEALNTNGYICHHPQSGVKIVQPESWCPRWEEGKQSR